MDGGQSPQFNANKYTTFYKPNILTELRDGKRAYKENTFFPFPPWWKGLGYT